MTNTMKARRAVNSRRFAELESLIGREVAVSSVRAPRGVLESIVTEHGYDSELFYMAGRVRDAAGVLRMFPAEMISASR